MEIFKFCLSVLRIAQDAYLIIKLNLASLNVTKYYLDCEHSYLCKELRNTKFLYTCIKFLHNEYVILLVHFYFGISRL